MSVMAFPELIIIQQFTAGTRHRDFQRNATLLKCYMKGFFHICADFKVFTQHLFKPCLSSFSPVFCVIFIQAHSGGYFYTHKTESFKDNNLVHQKRPFAYLCGATLLCRSSVRPGTSQPGREARGGSQEHGCVTARV